MDADLETLATALDVTTDDLLKDDPGRIPARPKVGLQPGISDVALLTLEVMQALLGYTSERRWLRYARCQLLGLFPDLPGQSGYNKRLRRLADTMTWLISALAAETSIATENVWVGDSTPVECARSKETVKRSDLAGKRSDLAGWAEYGYCAPRSRYAWGLRLHLPAPARPDRRLGADRSKGRRTCHPGRHRRPHPGPAALAHTRLT